MRWRCGRGVVLAASCWTFVQSRYRLWLSRLATRDARGNADDAKNTLFESMTWDEIREWKAEQERKGQYPYAATVPSPWLE
jgi:hypothetical protein